MAPFILYKVGFVLAAVLIAVASQVNTLSTLIYGITKCYKNRTLIALEQIYHNQLPNRTTCHQAIFYKKSLHDKYGYYSTEYKICSDYDFLLKCFLAEEVFTAINKAIANFSLNGTNDKLHHLSMKEMVNIKIKYNLASSKHLFIVNLKSLVFQILRRLNLSV